MKLCFVTYQFKTGGVERIFCALAEELKEHSVYLLTVTPFYDDMVRNIPGNVRMIDLYDKLLFKLLKNGILHFPKLSPLFKAVSLLLSVLYIRISPQFKDLTFINFADTISSMILAYYGSHKKNVYSWLHFNPKTIFSSRFKFLYDFIYKRFYKIICICEEQRDLMVKTVPDLDRQKLVVVYNLLDYKKIAESCNEDLSFKGDYIVMVARFDYRSKDFKTIIDAYADLPTAMKNKYKLVFVGDGPDMNDVCKSLVDNKDRDNIVFVGMQANPYKWIKNATVLVHSSKSEGLPTVLLEALACGTPVISTRCETGPSEILDYGNAGILVEVGNVKQMSSAIRELLENDELRKSYIKKGTEQLKIFSREAIVDNLNSVWKN